MDIPALQGVAQTGRITADSGSALASPPIQDKTVTTAGAPPPPITADLSAVVARTRDAVQKVASNLEFTVDGDTGKTIVRVVDVSTQEVIRQIPSEEMLSIAHNIDRLEGLLLKSKA